MWIEYCGLLTLGIYYLHAYAHSSDRRFFALRCLQVLMASWLCESISIDGFGFYQYSTNWRLMVGSVPFLVVFAWPAIVMSAGELARYLGASNRSAPWFVGVIVLLDAAFIEPICVRAQLWDWNLPGLLGVPLIGILGWAVFAAVCTWQFGLAGPMNAPSLARKSVQFFMQVVGIVITTVLILWASWQIAFRFVAGPVDERVAIIGTYVALSLLAVAVLRMKKADTVPSSFFVVRTPGCGLIALLFSQFESGLVSLHAYAIAFIAFYSLLISCELVGPMAWTYFLSLNFLSDRRSDKKFTDKK